MRRFSDRGGTGGRLRLARPSRANGRSRCAGLPVESTGGAEEPAGAGGLPIRLGDGVALLLEGGAQFGPACLFGGPQVWVLAPVAAGRVSVEAGALPGGVAGGLALGSLPGARSIMVWNRFSFNQFRIVRSVTPQASATAAWVMPAPSMPAASRWRSRRRRRLFGQWPQAQSRTYYRSL